MALGEAPRSDEQLPSSLGLGQLPQGAEGLLLGDVNESAGVDDEDVRCRWMSRGSIASLLEQPAHSFGVYGVLAAAQGEQVIAPCVSIYSRHFFHILLPQDTLRISLGDSSPCPASPARTRSRRSPNLAGLVSPTST
jgi:hypothetical protein